MNATQISTQLSPLNLLRSSLSQISLQETNAFSIALSENLSDLFRKRFLLVCDDIIRNYKHGTDDNGARRRGDFAHGASNR